MQFLKLFFLFIFFFLTVMEYKTFSSKSYRHPQDSPILVQLSPVCSKSNMTFYVQPDMKHII